MPSSPSPAAAWFDDPEHADVIINVCLSPTDLEPRAKKAKAGKGVTAAPTARVIRSYNAHAIILSMYSGYFKAQLSSAWQQAEAADGSPPAAGTKKVVTAHIELDDLDAMHELLRMMYSQELPGAAPSEPLFLQCLVLADRFQAASCMELLVTELACIPSSEVTGEVLRYVFQASPGVEAAPSYPSLLVAATETLLRRFSGVPEVIKDKDLLQQFYALPHAALLAWVQSDELRVDSENCVVFLVSAWVKANQDSTAEQLEELAHQIRVFHLGPAYLHHILPSLSWFKGCSGMQHLAAVLSCIRAGVTMKQGWEEERNAYFGLDCPKAWMAVPRLRSISPRTGSWVMGSSQLRELESGRAQDLSPPVYANGFLMRINLDYTISEGNADSSAASFGKILGVSCGINKALMEQWGLPVPDNTMLPIGSVPVQLGSAVSRLRMEDDIGDICVLDSEGTWGSSDFLGGSARTVLELVTPYLQEGQLQIQASFSGVDKVP